MTIQELNDRYYFHDSCITKIEYSEEKCELTVLMEFCYWAQKWYIKGEPELMELKVTFEGITDYDGLTGEIDYYSILDGDIKGDRYHLFIEDDFNREFYEYFLSPSDVKVEILRKYSD